MRRRTMGALMAYSLMAFMLIWPIWQLVDWLGTKQENGDALYLLYEVSEFQMDLLGSYMSEAGAMKDTEELNELKRVAFASEYTHDHLVQAIGDERMANLESLKELQQFVLRLQVGGERALKQEEMETLKEAGGLYRELLESYETLLNSGGELVKSKADGVMKADREMAELLKKMRK